MQINRLPDAVAKRERTKSQAKIQALRSAQKHQLNIIAEDLARGGDLLAQFVATVTKRAARIKVRK